MKSMKFKRTVLLLTLLVTTLSAVTGGTIAWFTDTVESTDNVIKSGTLDMEVYAVDAQAYNGDATDWGKAMTNASPALFNYDKWEPGYTQVKYVRIANAGNLAFSFQVNVNAAAKPAADKADLAEVIDVYMVPAAEYADFAAIKAAQTGAVSSIRALAEDVDGAAYGVLLPAAGKGAADVAQAPAYAVTGEAVYCIALHMREEAGNEYQNCSVGNGFGLEVLAIQYTYEKDSFDENYDGETAFPSRLPVVFNGKGYDSFDDIPSEELEAGGTIELHKNQTLSKALDIMNNITLNGNGYTISRAAGYTGNMFNVKAGQTFTVKDVIVDGGAVWTGEVNEHLQRGTVNSGVTATGAIVAHEANSKLILEEGAVLQNNDGANAVNLNTRVGAKLIVNGGEIINNHSSAGAIWGGGEITVNSGKINGNHGGIGGAIRVVTNVGSILTMNGGEMNHNVSDDVGGAIWAGGSKSNNVYILNGGEMAYNYSPVAGGAIYAGYYETVKIGGSFKMHDNTAPTAGAIRFHDHASFDMTGGEIYDNGDNALFLLNNTAAVTGGKISDTFSYGGGLGFTWGEAEVERVDFNLSTNHNTAYLAESFNTIKFTVNDEDEHFANFNFKPAAGYTYTADDEGKLICLNDGYEVYWDAATSTFRLKTK